MHRHTTTAPVDLHRRRLALGALAAACGVLAAWPRRVAASDGVPRLREARELMGTRVRIAVQSPDAAGLRPAVEAAFARMAALAAEMSHYAPDSRVAALGLLAGVQPIPVSAELMRVLENAQEISRRSGGAFDATVGSVGRWEWNPAQPEMPTPQQIRHHLPLVDYRGLVLDRRAGTGYLSRRGMRLDLGGIAKLPILQAGLEELRGRGIGTALIDGGGDVLAITAPGAPPWRVGVRDPRRPEQLLGMLPLQQGFVASSGDYERCLVRDGQRWHHVLDPRTGRSSQGAHGVTLLGESLAEVNGWGPAAMVLGADAPDLVRQQRLQALVVQRDGRVWMTPRMRTQLQAA